VSGSFAPGDLVYARGREWVAMPSPAPEWLCLRPLSGAEADVQLLRPELERDPVRPARFNLPDSTVLATQDAARILADALRLSLRRGAGPFRSAARLAFEPRPYQLVPLLMALRLPTVRLMIADDVGIGKTIEGGLILRELIDRGEVDSFTVLCPPHLVEQWTTELRTKFDLDAVAVTATTAARLERGLTASQTIFEAHPFTVVSLDYIKADKRRDSFARSCPKTIVVDEAHACVGVHQGRQQRFELLERLSEDQERHLILLTATPHSGDEDAFNRLLSLLNPAFRQGSMDDEDFRIRLARHLVQRRRIDIAGKEWGEQRSFPRHETTEKPYALDLAHKAFHEAALDYCLHVVTTSGSDPHHRRLAFWGTLALMRCVGSSPAAAASALRNRLSGDLDHLGDQVFDEDESESIDVEPASGMPDQGPLAKLIAQADQLAKTRDPKLAAVVDILKPLIAQGTNPVVFCRFIATADHVAAGLRKAFPKLRIEAVTGALTADERRVRVEDMRSAEQRILVATDCLSEGINLQSLFDAVIHYDLSWNPTRHQQREGRVDRFGQPSEVVRSVLLYSPDSAIDGAVLDVILRKADAIRKATGVTVPLPDERGAVMGALMNAVLLRKGRTQQLTLDLNFEADARTMEVRWHDAQEGERRSRARFAQNAIKPEEVAPEWRRWRELLGGPPEVRRFVERAMSRLDAPLQQSGLGPKAHLDALPASIRDRLSARGLDGSIRLAFEEPASANTEVVVRSHPLPATLAEALLEAALDPVSSPVPPIGRTGAWPTPSVKAVTAIAVLRLRFKLIIRTKRESLLVVEEAAAVAFEGNSPTPSAVGLDAWSLLETNASGNLAEAARDRMIEQARSRIASLLDGPIADYAAGRARQLAEDHGRVRASGVNVPKVSVEPVLPADVMAVFALIPGGV
jgi:superfamily II DNA or RNA helicase